jgi:hypothetical protein
VSAPEEWRWVPGCEGYVEASNLGRARRWYEPYATKPRLGEQRRMLTEPALIQVPGGSGYPIIGLVTAEGDSVRLPLHQAVLWAFFGPPPLGYVGCHFPDPGLRANALTNIRWASIRENWADAKAVQAGPDAVRARLIALRVRYPHLITPEEYDSPTPPKVESLTQSPAAPISSRSGESATQRSGWAPALEARS